LSLNNLKTSKFYFKIKETLFEVESTSPELEIFSRYGSVHQRVEIANIVDQIKQVLYNFNPFDTSMEFNRNLKNLQTAFFEKMVLLVTDLRKTLKPYANLIKEETTLSEELIKFRGERVEG
jgi:hypothetical protein